MEAYEGVDVQIYSFLTSALLGGEWSASRPCRCTPVEKAPSTHWIGGLVDSRAGLNNVQKRKFLILLDSNSNPSAVQPIASRYTDYTILAPQHSHMKVIYEM
jgi:hypothetical protein